ncbi:MAG: HAMP domain-containing protein, partial [Planctomycetota bacterium]
TDRAEVQEVYSDELSQKALRSAQPAVSFYSVKGGSFYDIGLTAMGKPLPEPGQPASSADGPESGLTKLGAVRVGMSLQNINLRMNRILWWAIAITLALITAGISLSFFLAGKITGPIQELVTVTNKVSSGDLNSRAEIKTGDEISSLAGSFNLMIEHIKEQTTQLEEARGSLEIKVQEKTRELQETHQKLLEASKMAALGTLSGGITHDFNNILFAIRGNAELLKLDFPPESKQYKFIYAIETSALRGAELTKKLKTFAQPHQLFKTTVTVNSIVQEIVGLIERTIEKMVTITTDLEPDLWTVEADSSQIYQVILNICINAKESMLPIGGGTLSIKTENKIISPEERRLYPETIPPLRRTDSTDKFVVLSVTDTGIGMDEETSKHIFEPFFTTKLGE